MALDLNDKTSNGNTITNHGATEWTTDFPFAASTEAVKLVAASSQYLTAADSTSLSVTGDLTIELWIKLDTLPGSSVQYPLVNKARDDGVNHRSFYYLLYNNGTNQLFRFIISPDGSYNGSNDVNVTWTPSTGTWYHVAVAWKASTKTAQFFVNGSQQGTDKTTLSGSIYDGTESLGIGTNNADTTPTTFFDGKMDEIRIWNTARTSTQISANYNAELTGSETGLVAYWPFEVLATAFTQSLSDTITFSDSLASKAMGMVLADTLSLSDSISRSWAAFLTLADTITISDAFIAGVGKVVSDAISFSDTILSKAITKLQADTITFSDSIFKTVSISFSDAITISDAMIKGIGKGISDTITFSSKIIGGIWVRLVSYAASWTKQNSTSSIWTEQPPTSSTWTESEQTNVG